VIEVHELQSGDVDVVVERIARQLAHDAAHRPLINPAFSRDLLADALHSARASTWTAHRAGRLVGHLFGARLANATHGTGIWIGPDGVSYDDDEVLDALYAHAATHWIDAGAGEHFVWTLDDATATLPWYQLGFARVHVRGVLALGEHRHDLPPGYALRRGTAKDLDLALALDDELDAAQYAGPSFARQLSTSSQRGEWAETLADPETCHYVVDFEGTGVAQCVTYPLAPQRSSFAHTVHLSGVVVARDHRRRGVALAMVDAALEEARSRGFEFAETSWRETNREASRYWRRYGFEPTYVRLHRTIGPY